MIIASTLATSNMAALQLDPSIPSVDWIQGLN